MRRLQILAIMLVMFAGCAFAQRNMDVLGRGLVVVPTGSTSGSTTNFVSWRRLGTEYYDVTYNLYKNGTKIASNLTTTSYDDSNASTTTQYQVAAVVRGVEQAKCTAVTAWSQYVYKLNVRCATGYIDVPLATVYDRNGSDVTANYSPNDAEFADLDGDGELEMIIKRLNTYDASTDDGNGGTKDLYAANSTQFVVLDAYDINWQTGAATLLWRIDCGPNMVSLNSTEINIIAFDWDEDGKAEVVLRGADDMVVYGSDGKTKLFTVGTAGANYRSSMTSHSNAQYAWTKDGPEYLVYMNGQTGAKFQVTTYPLPRLESGESDLNSAWGDGYGHRSTKHFLGAPYLDGRTASLFLGRGIYTREKMIAMDLNKSTHQWSTRWTWVCNNSNSPWYGNGYHNFIIADVDEDGRDEIVYGSMVIDDNGKGLSTTGYEHGDAQHVADFNPWRKGLEYFGCLEDGPYYGCNYRDATTSEVLYKYSGSGDDGRALMGNFLNTYPGSLGRSVGSGMIHSVTNNTIEAFSGDNLIEWGDLNFRIYWDGDLCSEILNSPGTAREAKIEKPGTGRLFTSSGCNMNNDSKNNPCFQGDLIGDWREEIVVRCGTNVRIYTSGMGTSYSMPCLWYDHQYRQAMVWQMMAYNQPPHLSYYLGEMEGYTQAPPPLLSNDRTEISSGGTISSTHNNKQVIACSASNMTINVSDGASPWVFTDNAPSWVQGTDVNGTTGTKVKITNPADGSVGATNLPTINRTYYTHTVTGGAFTGAMHLCKQGDGTLVLPDVTETYTGTTTVWAGTLQFNGTMTASPVSLKRFTTLNSDGGTFSNSITMEYASTLNVGGTSSGKMGSVTVGALTMGYGSRVVLDINGSGEGEHDWLNLTTLTLDTDKVGDETWENYGPDYLAPVFQLRIGATLANGLYPIGTCETVNGDLSKVVLEVSGMDMSNLSLVQQDGMLYLQVSGLPSIGEPTIEIVSMANYAGMGTIYPATKKADYYLPVVGVTTNDVNGVTPTLSGTFTSLDGTTKSIGSESGETLYSQNYESETAISGWTTPGANISLGTGDATYGKYFYVNTGSTNTRYAYQRMTNVDVSAYDQYSIEFDLALKSGNTDGIEFCVMSKNGTNPSNNWDNYAAINGNANMLFDLTAAKNSTSFTVNGTSTTTTLASETWYHVTLNVNQSARTVAWSISNGSSGTFNLPTGTNTEWDGFYLVAGRYYSTFKLDNIVVKSAPVDLSTYTFTEPGTLTVTASMSGSSYSPATATFTVEKPYYKLYESPDYSTIQAADAAATLGGSFSSEPFNSRWAYWSKANATYGDSYVMVSSGKDSGYLDDDAMLYFNRTSSDQYHLVQGFGIGHNYIKGNTTVSAEKWGDENTLVYHKIDLSRGGNASMDEGFTNANSDGTWSYDLYQNTTLCQVAAYLPVTVLIGDLNHDGYVNITDVVILSNYILGNEGNVFKFEADLNGDGSVNITDIVTLTNLVLNQ
ncbi:MAG: autotransporter-associated beta strand repeat-containing protein [Prevotella sp.]|nr:autotransporter-associated beta strand repeat-containing protein [Prevotella sp.]